MTFLTRALDQTTWPDYVALVERNGSMVAGCWCMAFHPEGVGRGATAAENRERRLARVRQGSTHAALVYDGNDCVGWCQFGSPAELPPHQKPGRL